MRLVEGRRLTGPNHLARGPLVVVEVALEAAERVPFEAAFLREVARMRVAVGLDPDVQLLVRPHRGGAVFAYPAPRDLMLACVEISEWAAASASETLAGRPETALEPKRTEIADMIARDRNPALLALEAEARHRGVPFLWDDETVSLGHGVRSVPYPTAALPAVDAVTWDTLGSVPIALVTGTNGKTTSSRLLASVAREAGFVVGSTSTDGVMVGGELVERGDWTGPIAARRVLREDRVELAVLETARGGILRRGLATDSCDVALITNIAADHLGDYGIDDLPAMALAKGVAAQAVRPDGTVVLNARDLHLVALAPNVDAKVVFFADLEVEEHREDTYARIGAHLAAGGTAVIAREGSVRIATGPRGEATATERELVRLVDVPITFEAAARYNVENVLGVVAAAGALGFPDDAIVRALRGFQMDDNPGRGQLLDRAGVKVLLDFGHNPHGVRAVLQLVRTLHAQSGGRLFFLAASPGDRSDADIEAVVHEIAAMKPYRLIARELTGYLRGRDPGVVPAIYQRVFGELGFAPEVYEFAGSEVASLERAFELAEPGDVVVLLVHMDQAAVRELLRG